MVKKSFLNCYWLILLLVSFNSLAADIQVYTDRDPVNLNESFQLVYETSGSVDDDPDFSVLKPFVDILSQSQSSNVSIVNGNYNSSKTWTLNVMARQAGKVDLPPVHFGSDKSMALSLQVNTSTTQSSQSEDFFSRLTVSEKQVYVQQEVIVTQSLYSSKNLSAYSLGELDFNGQDVVIESLGKEKQYKTRIGNRAYLVVEKSYAIYPQVAGMLSIKPVLSEARTASSSNSFFDPFGRSGNIVRSRSEEKILDILPIPLNTNMSPWLPAREFELTESWAENPPLFVEGEPLTRTLSIKAEGLTAAQLPVLPQPEMEDVKQYPDQPMINDVTNSSGITGYRIEKIAFIPTQAGKISLPAIEIPWWNTRTGKRQVARIPHRLIEVRAADPASKSQQVESPQLKSPMPAEQMLNPVTPIETNNGSGSQALSDEVSRWKWLSMALGFAWLMTMLAWIFLRSRSQSLGESESSQAMPEQLSLAQVLKQLESSCKQRNHARCRSNLIHWGQLIFEDEQIHSIHAVISRLPEKLATEIKKIEAALYAGNSEHTAHIIDFEFIIREVRQYSRDQQKKPLNEISSTLEPMYK